MRTSLRHMLRRKNKKRAGSGFTLAETLTAILLIGFVGLIITGGIQAGLYARSRVVDAANAEVLLSTTLTELQNELEAAQEIRTDDSGKLSYYLTASGWRSLQNGTGTDPGIRVQVFKGEGAEPGSSADMNYLLVSDAAASRRLYAGCGFGCGV